MKNVPSRLGLISERLLLIILFAAAGTLLIVVFSPWDPLLSGRADYLGRLGSIAFFVLLYLLMRRTAVLAKYKPLVFGLLALATAVTLDWIISNYVIRQLGVRAGSPSNIALVKLNEFVVVAAIIMAFTLASGKGLGEIYLQKGRLKLGLIIGAACFLAFAAGSIPMAGLWFQARDLSVAKVIPWIPWVLIFVFANSALEEFMFRGLFLRKLEPVLGKLLSNLTIALVFTLIHYGVTYTADQFSFLLILFPLALVLGWLAQKTDALWASILLHAGMDIPVILGIFSNL
jgi:membrane protease YdiL (CAAX protease family)